MYKNEFNYLSLSLLYIFFLIKMGFVYEKIHKVFCVIWGNFE